jgi:hypothetical protein
VTANNQPSLTGAATAGSLVTVYIDGTAVGTTTADGSGSGSITSQAPCRRPRIRYATATDTAGNVSAAATPWSFTVDTAAPAIPTGIALTAATDTGASASDGVTANNQPTSRRSHRGQPGDGLYRRNGGRHHHGGRQRVLAV